MRRTKDQEPTVHVEDTHPHQYLSHHLEDPCQTLSDIIIQIPLGQNHQVSFSHETIWVSSCDEHAYVSGLD